MPGQLDHLDLPESFDAETDALLDRSPRWSRYYFLRGGKLRHVCYFPGSGLTYAPGTFDARRRMLARDLSDDEVVVVPKAELPEAVSEFHFRG